MKSSDISDEVLERANELYWDSSQSVNRIAESLDLSKGALYGIIRPLAVGYGCPLCGSEVGYENRTAQEKDRLHCPECEWDGETNETIELDDEGRDSAAEEFPAADETRSTLDGPSDDEAALSDSEETRPAPVAHRPSMSSIAGGALIGAAVGLALVMWARRK